jgi:hypothetical protein
VRALRNAVGDLRLDDDTVERILDGLVDPVDAPPGYEAAVTLLTVARGLPVPLPARVARPVARTTFGFRPRLPVIAAALVLGGASGAAYAAGLPAAASSTAHDVLRSLGVSSSPRTHPRPTPVSTRPRTATTTEAAATRVAPAPAPVAADDGHRHARRHTPAKRHGHGAAISALAHSTSGTAGAKGATISAAASGGKSHAGEHGHNGTSGASHGHGHGHGQAHGHGHGSHRPR